MEIKVLQERITKKEEQIKKIEKRIAKWESNKTSEKVFEKEYGWLNTFEERKSYFKQQWNEKCDSELRCANRDLKEAQEALTKYKNQLQVEEQKEKALDDLPELFNELRAYLVNQWDNFDINHRDHLVAAYKEMGYKEFCKKFGYTALEKRYETNEHIHQENVKAARAVILDLINRVSSITGEITDYSGLYTSQDNQGYTILNGIVIGKEGKAKVDSIYAGGYNIQRLHIRVLVNKVGR